MRMVLAGSGMPWLAGFGSGWMSRLPAQLEEPSKILKVSLIVPGQFLDKPALFLEDVFRVL